MPGKQRPHSRVSKKGKVFKAGKRAEFGARANVRISFKHGLPSSRLGKAGPTAGRIVINQKVKTLIRAKKLPPPPKYVVISRPGQTMLKGRVKPIKLSRITLARPLPPHVASLQKEYLRRMRTSVQSGRLPPIEVIRIDRRQFLWEGRHRYATTKNAGFKFGWAAEMRYTGKAPFSKVKRLFIETHQKSLRRQEARNG